MDSEPCGLPVKIINSSSIALAVRWLRSVIAHAVCDDWPVFRIHRMSQAQGRCKVSCAAYLILLDCHWYMQYPDCFYLSIISFRFWNSIASCWMVVQGRKATTHERFFR
jgi:hypothetical protein